MARGWKRDVDPEARRLVLHKVRTMAGRLRSLVNTDDVEQDLLLNLLRRAPRFDPARAPWAAFVRLINNHHEATFLERLNGPHETFRRAAWSLSAPSPGGQALAETLEDRRARRSGQERAELTLDVQAVVADLCSEERQLCQALAHHSRSEAARRLGLSKSALAARIAALRRKFARGHLHDYL